MDEVDEIKMAWKSTNDGTGGKNVLRTWENRLTAFCKITKEQKKSWQYYWLEGYLIR